MTTTESSTFATALARFRAAGGLTQEELAERANLSVEAIGALERGVRTRPRPSTIRSLAEALQLPPEHRALLEQAARARDTIPVHTAQAEGDFLGAVPTGELVGREEERERLRAILERLPAGGGQLLLLAGEVGSGKTRLLQEVMVDALSRTYLVLTGSGSPNGPPSFLLLDALRPLPHIAPTGIRTEVQRRWKRIEALAAGVGEETHLLQAVTDLLLLVTRVAPVVVLLDDLQWADAATLHFLQHLARTTSGVPLFLGGSFQDVAVAEAHTVLAQLIQTLGRERLVERLLVRRLSLEETTQMVGRLMGEQAVSEEFVTFVYRRTKGIPRLIEQLIRFLGGRLELQGEIGAGAMGRVFRAFDRVREETVAAKLVLARSEIDLDALLRFEQEGAVLARLNHPHIVEIYGTFIAEHASCIIMKLLDGSSLGHILTTGPLPLDRAKSITRQVADALAYAHSQQIIHRDIKPDNVMVLDGDHVAVTDFGIARILQPDTSLQTIATTGMRTGTPLYMAPEQIEGKAIDARTDVYALGAMLYHMVVGRPPFEGNDALAVAVKHLQEEPIPPSQIDPAIPADWDALILKAMAKDPARRFQSAHDVERAVEALGVTPALHVTTRSPSRGVVPIGVASLAIVTALAVAMAIMLPHLSAGQAGSPLQRRLDAYLSSLDSRKQISGTVLVAREGHIVLSKGHGLADRKHQAANGPTVKYALAGVNFSINLVAALRSEAEGKLHGTDRICTYVPSCPITWKHLTVRRVIAGTSGLPGIDWAAVPGTPAQSLRRCQADALLRVPEGRTDYENCVTIVLGLIEEKITHQTWESVIRRAVLDPAGMRDTRRITDTSRPPTLAAAYKGAIPATRTFFSPYFSLYSTTADILRYDRALFGKKLLSPAVLRMLLTPRDTSPDPGIADARTAYKWKVGHIAGQRVIYTYDSTQQDITTVNMWFPRDRTAIIVISNDLADDALPIGVKLARLVYAQDSQPRRAVIANVKLPRGHCNLAIAPAAEALWFSTFACNHGALTGTPGGDGTLTRIDTESARITATIPINDPTKVLGNDPSVSEAAAGNGQLWTTDRVHNAVVRIDPSSNKITARVHIGIEAAGLAIGANQLWAATPADDPVTDTRTIVRVDLRTQKIVARISNATTQVGNPTDLAAAPDALWYVDWASKTVKRIDATTDRVVATIHAGPWPESLAIGMGAVWVWNHNADRVTRIDARTNAVAATIILGRYRATPGGFLESFCGCRNVAVGEGAAWAIAGTRTLARIDPRTNRVTRTVTLPTGTDDVAVADGSVWVSTGADTNSSQIARIDPEAITEWDSR